MRPKKGDVIILRVDHYGAIYNGIVDKDLTEQDNIKDEFSLVACTPNFIFGTKELRLVELTYYQIKFLNCYVDTLNKKIEKRIRKLGYYWLAHARLIKDGKNIPKNSLFSVCV